MISEDADGIWCCSYSHIHTKNTGSYLHSEFVFHILSTGCVMTPVIKAGNCLTVVVRYWIRGQFCRHNWRQLDVKSLSSEIGSRAEQTHRRWYQHQREMLALCCLTLVNGIQPTCYPIPPETLTHSVPLPPGTRHSVHVITAVSLAEVRYRSYLYKGI